MPSWSATALRRQPVTRPEQAEPDRRTQALDRLLEGRRRLDRLENRRNSRGGNLHRTQDAERPGGVSGKLARAVIDDALRALEPQLGPAESEPVPLDGGITNRNYRVRSAGATASCGSGQGHGAAGHRPRSRARRQRGGGGIGVAPDVVAFLGGARAAWSPRSSRPPGAARSCAGRSAEVAGRAAGHPRRTAAAATFSPCAARELRRPRARAAMPMPAGYPEVAAAAGEIARRSVPEPGRSPATTTC